MKKREPAKAPKTCRECRYWKEVKEKVRVSELVAKAIQGIEERIKTSDFKPTVSDYLKLVQIEKELEQEDRQAREIKVTWVEQPTTSNCEK